jgi:hypothetical protein
MSKKIEENERQSIIMFDVFNFGGDRHILRSCLRIFEIKGKRLAFSPSKSHTTGSCFLIMLTEFCRIIRLRFIGAKQTLIRLSNIAQNTKEKSCGLKISDFTVTTNKTRINLK